MKNEELTLPTVQQLEEELSRARYRKRYHRVLRSTIGTLITVAAIAVLVATLWMPVLQIYGSSMAPTLSDGEIVLTMKTSEMKTGDVIAFYYNNKILVKRVIAQAGDWVNITPEGDVYVNDRLLTEPYLDEKSLGDCNIELPYQVPESRVFVMGDHRSISVDSRNTALGCVAEEQIVGKLIFRVWPLDGFGEIE
jgi:signal peptidase I